MKTPREMKVVGRAVHCAPPTADQSVLIRDDGAHGVTRPIEEKI